MALEDYMEPEVAVTAVVTAAIFSPRARRVIRRGLVYGMAGALIAGDAIASFARSVGQGVQEAGASAADTAQNTMNQAKEKVAETTTAAQKRTTHKAASDQTKASTEGTGG
ncbi:MAG: hypothetical protein JOZ18_10000 [Chloroflexi bacterium]|nr:hypothetical protein [Chloroflexota bacterium]